MNGKAELREDRVLLVGVPAAGYAWERRTSPVSDRYLTARPSGGGRDRWYLPMRDTPTLYRDFADLARSPVVRGGDAAAGAILAFADRYGGLGTPAELSSLDVWRREIWDMYHVLKVWEARAERHWLKEWFRIEETKDGEWVAWYRALVWGRHRKTTAAPGGRARWRGRVRYLRLGQAEPGEDPRSLAWRFLRRAVNARLEEHCTVQLTADLAVDLLVPKNLLGALWLQVAWMFEARDGLRRCATPRCGRWVGGKKVYCTRACRQQAYRDRVADQAGSKASRRTLTPRPPARAARRPAPAPLARA